MPGLHNSSIAPIPVTIIGGYLGSGKTTLINDQLRQADGKRLAILVNDFGDLAIDADLIEAEEDDLISLAGGCVCCSYGSGMMEAFEQLKQMDPAPDHVILEASGVALPGAIASSLSLIAGFTLFGIVVLVDAETIRRHADDRYIGDTITTQLNDADLIIMNKTDLIDEETVSGLTLWLADKAGFAIIEATAQARVARETVLSCLRSDRKPIDRTDAPHAICFVTETVQPEPVNDLAALCNTLIDENPALVRAKGFAGDARGVLHTIQIVGTRYEISTASPGARPGLVLIFKNR